MTPPASSLQQAIALHQQGRQDLAEPLYQEILRIQPEHFDALHLLGVIALQKGELRNSIDLLSKAIAVDASQSAAHSNLGNALMSLQRPIEALVSYDRAIALKPDYAEALNNRGMALRALQRQEEALLDFEMALQFKPDYLEALQNQADTLRESNHLHEALSAYERLLTLKPESAVVLNNIGYILGNLGRHEEAVPYFERAIALHPQYASALRNLGGALLILRNLQRAADVFQQLLELDPDSKETFANMHLARQYNSDWTEYPATLERVVNAVHRLNPLTSPFMLLAISDSAALQLKCAQCFTSDAYPASPQPLWQGERYTHHKIKVAYLSADFQAHATAYLMAELFETHDKSRFETYALSFGPDAKDQMRTRLISAFDQFIDVGRHTDLEVAQLLCRMEIDIAIDLKGYTTNCRSGIFAYRAAPIQVNYLGYPGTMGADYIDYIIADERVIPEANKIHYSEQVVYLPDSYQVNDSKRVIADKTPSRAEVGLPSSGFVFCCFNYNYKITPDVFDIWMRLLGKVEGSVLWLLADSFSVYNNLRDEAAKRGIHPERLVFAARASLDEHLARQRLADLFLDTLPCNAHTTASDALWAGLPVLTRMGESFASRVAGSLLHAIGLPELITSTSEDYEALALELATSPEKLAAIKTKLKKNRESYPLFNTDRFRRHMESAYSSMWQRYQDGLPAQSFSVKAVE